MLSRVGIAVAAALVAVPLAWAGAHPASRRTDIPGLGPHTATAVLSDDSTGARPVALTIRLRAELQCGRLQSTAVTVSLPTSMRVPSTVPRTAVAISGKVAASVSTRGTRVLIRPAQQSGGVICDVIGPGVVAITFARGAGLGNPPRAGSYAFGVVATPRGGEWRGTLAIH